MEENYERYRFEFPSDQRFKQLIALFGKYRMDELYAAGKEFRRILAENRDRYENPAVQAAAFTGAQGTSAKKITYQIFLAICLGTRDNFLFFHFRMMADVKRLTEILCLCPTMEYTTAKACVPTLFNGETGWRCGLNEARKDELSLFCELREGYYSSKSRFSVNRSLADLIWEYLNDDGASIRTEADLPSGCTATFDFESQAMSTLESLLWVAKGGLPASKSGSIAYPSVKKLQQSIGIEEFYPGMKTGCGAYARSSDLLFPFARYSIFHPAPGVATPRMLKSIWEGYCAEGGGWDARWILLGDYEKGNAVDKAAFSLGRFIGPLAGKRYFNISGADNHWLNVTDVAAKVMGAVGFREMCASSMDPSSFIFVPYEGNKSLPIAAQAREMTQRAVCGYYALMCSWGLAECAFSKEEPADGSFDRMKWVRLTGLGRYVLGFSLDYKATASSTKKKEWFVDPERTILVAEVDKPVSLPAIAKFGKKITDRRFLIDPASIMTACKNDSDILKATAMLKSIIGDPMPKVWADLFTEINERMNISVDEPESYMMIKLPQNNANLMRLCGNDPVIKGLAIKCEGARLMVKTDDYPKILKAFRALGYMPDMTQEKWREAKPKPERKYGYYY